MNKFLPNENKTIGWPNSPNLVKKPNRLIPKFEKYYPSISDMDFGQKSFYQYWQKQWEKRHPVQADLSYIYTYIYEVLENAMQDKNNLFDYISELNALKNCYPERISRSVSSWITDLLDYNENYLAVYENLIADDNTWNNIMQINKLLNLKLLLGEQVDRKDFLYFGNKLGVNLYKTTIKNINWLKM